MNGISALDATSSPKAYRVLVVDDEPANIRFLEALLQSQGYATITARSGIEALATAESGKPDVIVMDAVMPGLDGFDTVVRLKAQAGTRLIPVIMVTALDDRESKLRAVRAGAEEFLSKPIDVSELSLRVRNLVRLKDYGDRLNKFHLEAHEQRFRLVVEAAPNAMLLVDRQRRITLVNRKAVDLFGYDREELIGQSIERLVPERFREAHPGHVHNFLANPKARAMGAGRELYGQRKDGSEVPIEIGLNPIEMPDGSGLFTLASIIDITERKRSESAHQRLAAIVESSEDAIVSKALDGTITSWNRGAELLFGYTAVEAIGKSIMMLVPERLLDEEERTMEAIRRHERLDHFETLRRRKDGSEVDVSVRISPVLNSTGEVVGESKIARDITELKLRDAELQRSNAELEQFAYVASHDLQEPLRMVANYTELLAQRYRGKLDEKGDKYIHYASDGARRMQRLVADLLAYSRVGSQGKPLLPVNAGKVLDSVVESIHPLIRDTGASIEYGALPWVMADELQLGQLFQNLIGNAIKFRSEAPPRVQIGSELQGSRWLFSVTDNGIGLDVRFADRIFQMFQRLHAVGKFEGSGIGLAIAKRIVERHNGHIWVESEPGKGTTFRFTLRGISKTGDG